MPKGTPADWLSAADADEVHLAFPREVHDELMNVLFPSEDHPFHGMGERGAFENESDRARGFGSWLGGNSKSTDTSHDTGLGYQFSEDYHERAVERAKSRGGGLIRIHTQPGGVRESPIDTDSAARVYKEDRDRLPVSAPWGAAITNDAGEWTMRVYEGARHDDDPIVTHADCVRIVGPTVNGRALSIQPTGRTAQRSADLSVDDNEQDSTIQLWGEADQATHADLRVGIVGCGGVGSILSEHLARLGVGELVFVDFDRLEEANFNRAQGARHIDVRQERLKTEVAERVARRSATTKDFQTYIVDGSVVDDDPEYAAIPALLDCDVILSGVDAARPRQVLGAVARAHCIPVIDGGSLLHADNEGVLEQEAKVETTVAGPGWPCFSCQRVWTQKDVDYEAENPEFRGKRGYVPNGVDPEEDDDAAREPAVIGVNAMVAGLMQRRLLAIVLGSADGVEGTLRLQIRDVEANCAEEATCPTCGRPLDADLRDDVVATIDEQIAATETAVDDAKARLPAVRIGLEMARAAQETVAGLDAARDRLADFKESVSDLQKERESLVEERSNLEPLAGQLDDLLDEQADLVDDYEAYERAEYEYEEKRDAVGAVDDAREEMYGSAREAAQLERRLEREFGNLDEQIAEQQEIKDETRDAHQQYVRNEADAERVDERRERVLALYDEVEEEERERREAETELMQVEAEFDADRHAELDEQINRFERRETTLDTKLDEARSDLEDARAEVSRLESIAEQLDRWKETHVQLERDIKFAETVRDGVRDAGPKMRELIASRIGERANQIYQTLRGTGRESLTWDETYEITVQDGSQRKPFGNLSGGEKMAAALAVRLAIMERVSPLDIAFLDEPTANLDSEKKNNLVSQLEHLDAFEQLCVISHDDTFESMTEYTVTLEKPDRETHVVSDAGAETGTTEAD